MGRRRGKEGLNRVCKVIPCPRPSRVQLLHLSWIFPFVFGLPLLSWGDLGSTGCCCPPASCFSCPNPLGLPGWVRSSARPPARQQPSFFITMSVANCSHACSGISAPFCRVTTAGRAQRCHLAAAKPCGVWSHRSATANPSVTETLPFGTPIVLQSFTSEPSSSSWTLSLLAAAECPWGGRRDAQPPCVSRCHRVPMLRQRSKQKSNSIFEVASSPVMLSPLARGRDEVEQLENKKQKQTKNPAVWQACSCALLSHGVPRAPCRPRPAPRGCPGLQAAGWPFSGGRPCFRRGALGGGKT